MASKRQGGGVKTVPLSHFNDQGARERWPVLVYRLQSHRGWEVYSDPDKDPAAATTAAVASGKRANAANKALKGSANANKGYDGGGDAPEKVSRTVEELTAAPRAGCIEVRKMRLRIQLFQQHTPWNPNRPPQRGGGGRAGSGKENQPNGAQRGHDDRPGAEGEDGNAVDENGKSDDEYDSDAPGADGWNNNSLLVRRRDTLLVTTRRGMGAVMFRFKSTRDCVDFCDRLVYLNRDYLFPAREDAEYIASSKKRVRSDENDAYIVNGMDRRERHVDEMSSIKRHKGVVIGDAGVPEQRLFIDPSRRNHSGCCMQEGEHKRSEEVKQSRRQEEMTSYLVKLAHSKEFRGFVDELERGLQMGADTAAIHAALGAV